MTYSKLLQTFDNLEASLQKSIGACEVLKEELTKKGIDPDDPKVVETINNRRSKLEKKLKDVIEKIQNSFDSMED